MEFPTAYRRHVVPRLERLIRIQAIAVAQDDITFAEAAGKILRRAHQMGAGYLPDRIVLDLEDWVVTKLATAVDVASDAADHWRAMSPPERLAAYNAIAGTDRGLFWTFLATDPEARAARRRG